MDKFIADFWRLLNYDFAMASYCWSCSSLILPILVQGRSFIVSFLALLCGMAWYASGNLQQVSCSLATLAFSCSRHELGGALLLLDPLNVELILNSHELHIHGIFDHRHFSFSTIAQVNPWHSVLVRLGKYPFIHFSMVTPALYNWVCEHQFISTEWIFYRLHIMSFLPHKLPHA